MRTVGSHEPVPGVERLHLGQRPLAHRTRAVGGTIEHGVVEHHHVPVRRGVDVELEALGAGRQTGREGVQRVLGMRPRRAPVGEETGARSLEVARRLLRVQACWPTAIPPTADRSRAGSPASA